MFTISKDRRLRDPLWWLPARASRHGMRFHDGPVRVTEMGIEAVAKESVGSLCADFPKGKRTETKLVGTCFFITAYSTTRLVPNGYLVTAKHVYEGLQEGINPRVRLNLAHRIGKVGVEYIALTQKWFTHPDPAVDLAATPFETDKDVLITSLAYDKILTTPKEWIQSGNECWPPRESEELVYIACLNQHLPYDRNLPVVRHGKLALSTDELIHGLYGPSSYYLMDSHIYPGNSGAPVWIVDFVKPHPQRAPLRAPFAAKMLWFGVLSAAHPELQEVFTISRLGKFERKEYFNLGISFVTPAEKIRDILELKELRDMREAKEPQPPKPFPVSHNPQEGVSEITKQEFEQALKKASRKAKPSEPAQEKPGT